MRLVKGVAIVFWVLTFAAPADTAELDEGFLGIRWGADLRHMDGFQLLYAKNDLRYYVQPDTVRTVDGYEIPRVVFGTYQHRFFAAYLDIDTAEAFEGIRAYMESRYGFPKMQWSAASGQTTHRWTYNRVRIKLKSTDGGRMKLAFYEAAIADSVNEAEAEREHETSRRFLPIDKDRKPPGLPLLVF